MDKEKPQAFKPISTELFQRNSVEWWNTLVEKYGSPIIHSELKVLTKGK